MSRRSMAILSLVVVIAMIAIAVWVASLVPAGAALPIHWDATGNPNGYAGKWKALLLPPAMTVLVSLLFYFLPVLEPRNEHLQRSQGLVLAGWGGLILVNIVVELTVVSGALHWAVPVTTLMLAVIGLLFVLIGNQLGKSRSMFLVGIRTPWTLSSEEVWIKTHRLGGKLMVGAGVVLAFAGFVPLPPRVIPMLVIALIVVIAAIPVAYSYVLWRREQRTGHTSG